MTVIAYQLLRRGSLITTDQKVIKNTLGLPWLTEMLDNVSRACRVCVTRGIVSIASWGLYAGGGDAGLQETSATRTTLTRELPSSRG